VLDPFAGGGAIPLEAMRLGCEVTAMDINPVAWFILKCTLEYPQKLAGQTRPLPDFALQDGDFLAAFLKARGFKGASLRTCLQRFGHGDGGDVPLALVRHPESGSGQADDPLLAADLAWHVRAWGRWVLARARAELASFYPTYAEWSLPSGEDGELPDEPLARLRLLEPDAEGQTDAGPLNAGFDAAYLNDPRKPRWIAKPTVAYLWARTVTCKQCRATLPLLKTRWLCKKERKRVLLTMEPNDEQTGVLFSVQTDVPQNGGNAAQRREHDKRIGAGTMSRTGATCPCCGAIATMADIRFEGRAGRLGAVMTAVVVDGPKGKEYRLPTDHERAVAEVTEEQLQSLYADIPFGLPEEPLASEDALGFRVPLYGFDTWRKLFTNRQLLALGGFVLILRRLMQELDDWPESWREAVIANLALVNDRLADYSSAICSWHNSGEKLRNTFGRFALPIVWDYTEVNPLSDTSGNFLGALDWVSRCVSHALESAQSAETASVQNTSAVRASGEYDAIVTDPPYYDAIPYSDLMDFFHVWLRRSISGLSDAIETVFSDALGPKWNHDTGDGELIDDASRFGGDKERSKQNYEDGMARSFSSCHAALRPDGRLVVVFANKHPDAWETLVAALIRAGFVVDGSWPIQTEMSNRTRSLGSAALASSVWIVCKKRPVTRPGWDNIVLGEMRDNITQQLRDFWDAGIRGPDFVWAATGPALEAFSKHPVVKKANDPNQLMSVSAFLREVRRMVVDFVVGRVLTRDDEQDRATGLDDVTTYYLLHRHDFGMADAPIGGCILYALSCNLSDAALVNQYDLLAQSGKGKAALVSGHGAGDELAADAVSEGGADDPTEDTEETGGDPESGSGQAKVKLKPWHRRQGRNLGLEAPGGRPAPLIDQVHKLMHLWRAGDQIKVNDYLDARGLQHSALFNQLLQALIELSGAGSEERALLEALSNHVAARGDVQAPRQGRLQLGGAGRGSI
jgi:adenine-specific DNA methylase